jgi:hypothetical protein
VIETDNSTEARTERLYWFLRNMGLSVIPVMQDGRWRELRVSVESAFVEESAECAAEASVVPPVKGAKVAEPIEPAQCNGMVVIDFPTPG